MLLKSLSLRNIRSYTDEKVEFPQGMTLLAGDIGCGKTTILLALEFALFGIQRGELSGAALLRHGEQRGTVTLAFSVAGKEVSITRGLKRGNGTISQETGSITIDGLTTELTAQELKAKVLELLQYPASLLATGKRPLFRYTVYTPQEEMKAIIYEKPEERLDTLRKLFDIDKYKRVRENGLQLIRELRKEETELKARIDELGKEVIDEKKTGTERAKLQTEIVNINKKIEDEKKKLSTLQIALEAIEKERFAIEELKKRVAIAKNQVENTISRKEEVMKDRANVEQQITETEKRLTPADVDENKLKELAQKLKEHELKIKKKEDEFLTKETEQNAIIKQAETVVRSIVSLTHCPTCKQDVNDRHKTRINDEEARKIRQAKERLAQLASLRPELEKKRAVLEEKQQELLQKQRLIEANKEKLKTLDGFKQRRESMTKMLEQLTGHEKVHQETFEKAQKELNEKKHVDEEEYLVRKKKVETHRNLVQGECVKEAELKKDVEGLTKELARVAKRKAEQKAYAEQLHSLQQRLAWLNKHLLNVSHAIEKAMFTSVHGLFNEYFKEWFSTLMEDETLSVRLDAEFTPVIVQDGYETSIEHLSGGEKTSVALAYRLSLNKAINEFLSHINTKGLLILDEPTDGFSSEQLDRVREVLDQLKLEQVLIVSHEQQMEGYVDHVIRVEKTGNESNVT